MEEEKYILGLDIGTTTVRCIVYDKEGNIKGSASDTIEILAPQPGWAEIDPDQLWIKVVGVLQRSLQDNSLKPTQIASLGICSQRASFTIWNKNTGKHYHNFITWMDLRSDSLVTEWNNSFSLRSLRFGGKVLHSLTRMPRWKAGSIYTFMNNSVPMRLLWAFENISGLRQAAKRDEVMFGCVDTFILYKLTGKHVTEISNAAGTGMFDPFTFQWGAFIFNMIGLPMTMLPKVVDSAGDHLGTTPPDLLGIPIPIKAVLADQSASVFGSGCWSSGAASGSAKMTMGTGSFFDVVTDKPHASMNGLIPLVGWKIGDDVKYLAEGSVHDTGGMVTWGKRIGMFDDVKQISETVSKLPGSGGVYFVPGFHGQQVPEKDPKATAGFIGLSLNTTKEEMLRALLESISFSMRQLVDAFVSETNVKFSRFVVDGGVAQNDFILQQIAELTSLPVIRADTVEMSAWGVASMAGIQVGFWHDKQAVAELRHGTEEFNASGDAHLHEQCLKNYETWLDACIRFRGWYKESED